MFDSTASRMMMVRASIVTLVLCTSSCNERDAAGHVDELRDLAYTEEIRIGSVDDPVIGFSRIRLVRVSEKGEVYVLEGSEREVRVFSAEGKRLRVIGGPGEGPGEFSLPTDMGLLGDTLWVADGRAQRLSWFGPDSHLLFTTPARGVPFESGVRGVSVTLTPSRPRSDGLIESDRTLFVSPDREIRSYRYPVILFDRQGTVVDTVGWETAEETAPTYRVGGQQLYAPYLRPSSPVNTKTVDGQVVLDWSVPSGTTEGLMHVVKVKSVSDSVYRLNLHYNEIPVPTSVLDSLIEPSVAIARALGRSEREVESALRDAIRLPEFRPPVRVVHAGSDGTLWLQLNTPTTDVSEWVLIGSDGSPRGKLRLPPALQIYHSALPTVWVVALDSLDVPWLIRLKVN